MTITQEQIDDYVRGALCYPIHNVERLVAIAVLHFDGLPVKDARYMVATSLLRIAMGKLSMVAE